MKNKIVGILTCLMLVLTTIVLVPNDLKVEATSGGGGGEGEDSSLNNSYIWERTVDFANVIYNAYEPGEIPKGRAFGSKGGNYTVNNILFT